MTTEIDSAYGAILRKRLEQELYKRRSSSAPMNHGVCDGRPCRVEFYRPAALIIAPLKWTDACKLKR